jgi:P27 family predicted phage terminase small subunit
MTTAKDAGDPPEIEAKLTRERPKPPDHLSEPMKAWWRSVMGEHDLDPHRLHLLRLAAEAYDRAQGAREVLAREGITCIGKYGPKQHPAVAVERDAKTQFARLVRDLKLDPPPLKAAGRPLTWNEKFQLERFGRL